MGRLVSGPYTTNKNLTNTALENQLDVFHYLPSTYNGCEMFAPCRALTKFSGRNTCFLVYHLRL